MTRRQSDTEIESQAWSMHVTMMHMLDGKEMFLSLDLNVSNDKLFLMSIGIVFHSFGAANRKSPGCENSSSAGNHKKFVGKWSEYSQQFVIDEKIV